MPDNAVATLRIHRSLTVTPHGQQHKSTVTCPRTGHVVDTSICTSCDGLRRMLPPDQRADENGLGWRVLCEPGPEAIALRRSSEDSAPRVADVMTTEVVCVSPDVSAQELAAMFITRRLSSVPVVDRDGNAIGIVSKTDLVRLDRRRNFSYDLSDNGADSFDPTYELNLPSDATVRDMMTRSTFALAESTSLRRAAAELVGRALHRAPVLDARGRVVGVVSALDILRWFAAQ